MQLCVLLNLVVLHYNVICTILSISHKLKDNGYTYTKILPPYLQEHRGFLLVKVSVHTFPFLAGLVCTRLAISMDYSVYAMKLVYKLI